MRVRVRKFLVPAVLGCVVGAATPAAAAKCPAPTPLGPSPTRLLVVVPGTAQGPERWATFLDALRKDPRSTSLAWLVFDHGVGFTSRGSARQVSLELASCVDQKMRANGYRSVTLIGHSMGGMLTRRAYLEAAGAFVDRAPSPKPWAGSVDRILLFASVNKGMAPGAKWWGPPVSWLLRTFPHPRFVVEDFAVGSDFIADVRIAWIRHFGVLQADQSRVTPHVVQFWGTADSVVTEKDNADLEAFSGNVIERVPEATHADLPLLDPARVSDPQARWSLFRQHLLEDVPVQAPPVHQPRRVLFIVRGIRDSANSEWVSDLREKAIQIYGEQNVEDPDYGFFSAAHFAFRPLRAENIPQFRDRYAQRLAENPLTEFDFIGHSNGTYILGQSLLTTPSMRFRNVVLAAPVLPTDFDWHTVFQRRQVERVRYDTAMWDWPVGILCPALRAVGFSDVGPSGVVLFGEGRLSDGRVRPVGWYQGGHGEALRTENRPHLLRFAAGGGDLGAATPTSRELGGMHRASRATPYIVWLLLVSLIYLLVRWYRAGRRVLLRRVAVSVAVLFVVYAVLDII